MTPTSRWTTLLALSTFALSTLAHAAGDAGACKYVPVGELPIRLAGPSLEPLVDGAINDVPALMLIGTGNTQSSIMRAAADKRGLTLVQTGRHTNGVGGNAQIYGTRLKDFSAGPFHSGKAGMPVVGEIGGAPIFDAVLGSEFLFQADMELALTSKHIKFFRANDCADTFLAYWDKDAMEVPFTKSDSRDLTPHFTVEINGKPFDAIISTGSARSSINARAAEKAGVRTDSPGVTRAPAVQGVGGEAARWDASFTTFTLGSETIQNASLAILEMPANGHFLADVVLGRDFLRAHRVLFAMSQQRLYVSYTGGDVFYKPQPAVTAMPATATPPSAQ